MSVKVVIANKCRIGRTGGLSSEIRFHQLTVSIVKFTLSYKKLCDNHLLSKARFGTLF